MTPGVKKGKNVSDKDAEVQVLYHKLKMRDLESEACHRQLHMDNAKEIVEIGKELEFWKHCDLSGEKKVQELCDEFEKQGKDCLDMGIMGGKLEFYYLLTSPYRFDKALEAYKKERQ